MVFSSRTAALVLCLGWAVMASAKPPSVKKLLELTEGRLGVPLTGRNFSSALLHGPRKYGGMALLTAGHPKYQCTACPPAKAAFATAARSYAHARSAEERDLFFFVVDVDSAREVFGHFQLRSIPFVVYFPPEEKRQRRELAPSTGGGDINALPHIPPQAMPGISSKHILSLAERSGHRSAAGVGQLLRGKDLRSSVIVLAALVAALGLFMAVDRAAFPLPCRRPAVVMAGSWAVYLVGVSGVVYCVIRASPFYVAGAGGKASVFGGDPSGQTVLEGLMVGAMHSICAICVIVAISVAKSSRSQLTSTAVAALALCVFAGVLLQIIALYSSKTAWYSPKDLVPMEVKEPVVRYAADAFARGIKAAEGGLDAVGLDGEATVISIVEQAAKLVGQAMLVGVA